MTYIEIQSQYTCGVDTCGLALSLHSCGMYMYIFLVKTNPQTDKLCWRSHAYKYAYIKPKNSKNIYHTLYNNKYMIFIQIFISDQIFWFAILSHSSGIVYGIRNLYNDGLSIVFDIYVNFNDSLRIKMKTEKNKNRNVWVCLRVILIIAAINSDPSFYLYAVSRTHLFGLYMVFIAW